MPNGRALSNPPLFVPPMFGLLSIAQDMTAELPSHWEAGIVYQPLCSDGEATYDECLTVTGVGAVPEPAAKTATFISQRRAATPFTVYVRKDCSAPTFWNSMTSEQSDALLQSEAWQIERAFWTGGAGGSSGVVHPHLAVDATLVSDGDTLEEAASVVDATPRNIVRALGALEQSLADCYQGIGVIHVPAQLGPHLTAWGLIERLGTSYITANGNQVALGRGYTGSSPAGALVAGQVWMYATGAVFYGVSPMRPVTPVDALDRDDNTLESLAERTCIVGYDCCLKAIPVDIATTLSGTT